LVFQLSSICRQLKRYGSICLNTKKIWYVLRC